MIKLSVFQKEILINIIISIIGIILDICGAILEFKISSPINDILIGVGCSLVASSVVAFMSFIYRKRTTDVNNYVKTNMMTLYKANIIKVILDKVKSAKSVIDICYLDDRIPYALFTNEEFINLLSKEIKIRIILSEIKEKLDQLHEHRKKEFIYMIKDLSIKFPNIELYLSEDKIPLDWIRIDDFIIIKLTPSNNSKKDIYTEQITISKPGSKEAFEQYEILFTKIIMDSKRII